MRINGRAKTSARLVFAHFRVACRRAGFEPTVLCTSNLDSRNSNISGEGQRWDMAQTRRLGVRNQFAQLADAPRFSPCYQYAALWGTLRVGIEQQAACPHGTRLHLQNRKLFFRLPSKSDRLLAGEFSRT
jgi:hypothetical protein